MTGDPDPMQRVNLTQDKVMIKRAKDGMDVWIA